MTYADTLIERLILAAFAFAGGVTVGLLLAPQPGREVRRRLATGAAEGARTVERRTREAAEPVAERVREGSHSLAGRVVPQLDGWDVVDGPGLLRDLPGLPRRP
ncbi:MAG: YtxH domain-containing protein [Rhodothermales bacterium]|nr:YtxH domain-containing protein [Rhodothermales bacterium]